MNDTIFKQGGSGRKALSGQGALTGTGHDAMAAWKAAQEDEAKRDNAPGFELIFAETDIASLKAEAEILKAAQEAKRQRAEEVLSTISSCNIKIFMKIDDDLDYDNALKLNASDVIQEPKRDLGFQMIFAGSEPPSFKSVDDTTEFASAVIGNCNIRLHLDMEDHLGDDEAPEETPAWAQIADDTENVSSMMDKLLGLLREKTIANQPLMNLLGLTTDQDGKPILIGEPQSYEIEDPPEYRIPKPVHPAQSLVAVEHEDERNPLADEILRHTKRMDCTTILEGESGGGTSPRLRHGNLPKEYMSHEPRAYDISQPTQTARSVIDAMTQEQTMPSPVVFDREIGSEEAPKFVPGRRRKPEFIYLEGEDELALSEAIAQSLSGSVVRTTVHPMRLIIEDPPEMNVRPGRHASSPHDHD